MAWALLATFEAQIAWQYSPPVDGEYFRINHRSPAPVLYGRGLLCQAQFGFENEIYDIRKLFRKPERDIFQFVKPLVFSDRRIGFKAYRVSGGPWTIDLEVWIE